MKSFTGNITDPLDKLNSDQEGTFKDGSGIIVLQKGDLLFRFCSHIGAKYSDCWTDKETIKTIFQLYIQRIKQSSDKNKNAVIKSLVYDVLGIAKTWSKLEFLLVVEIKKNLIAYEGSIREQSFFQSVDQSSPLRAIKVSGTGGRQYLIPKIKNYSKDNDSNSIHQFMVDAEMKKFTESSWYKRFVMAGHTI
jgi:hypothetical protein